MSLDQRKRKFLARIKSKGLSSPAGVHWKEFHELLTRHRVSVDSTMPPVPFILAASGESNRSKHQRLSVQLDWAIANHCFDEAIDFLDGFDDDDWNSGTQDEWGRDSYWR